MLARLPTEYVAELPHRFAQLEQQVLAMEHAEEIRQAFEEACRITHSLKGSASTHGLPMVSAICHPLEDRLVAWGAGDLRDGQTLVSASLAHIDLMRQVQQATLQGREDTKERLKAVHGAAHAEQLKKMS